MSTVRFESRFKKLKEEIDKQLRTKAEIAVQMARNEILETLTGDRTGRQYRVPGTGRTYSHAGRTYHVPGRSGGVTYTASAPGEPPASMLGGLRQNILTEVQVTDKEIIAAVGSPLPYSLQLELGTVNMAPRPWLKPSLQRAAPKIKDKLGERWF